MATNLIQRFHFNGGRWPAAVVLALILLSGTLLRLDHLDSKSLTHPEAYVPGIELPDGISEPPPRVKLYPLIWWHFHGEPHPQGYYFMMWVWTKLFGTSLYALRLPSVLFGIGSIMLIFWVAALLYDHKVGLLSAAFLAFNGHQIYWSQMARMYSMACFLGLLSTLLWLQLLRDSEKRPLREALYVAVGVLGVFTEILFWPFLAAQILWTTLRRGPSERTASRMLTIQALTVIIGSPVWAHAIYQSRPSPLEHPSWAFLREFLSFGFLFERDLESYPVRNIPAIGRLFLVIFAAICIGRALSDRGHKLVSASSCGGLRVRHLLPVAAGAVAMILTMASVAWRRRWQMSLTTIVPIAAVFLPSSLSRAWQFVEPKLEKAKEYLSLQSGWHSPFLLLAFLPPVIVFLVSLGNSVIASRLFLLFTPYLLIVIAVGLRNLVRRPFRSLFIGIASVLVAIHFLSIVYYRNRPSDVIDYQDLAQKIIAYSKENDLIFVHERSWITTPTFYYLKKKEGQLVAGNFQDAVAHHPDSRIWLIQCGGLPPTDEMQAALTGLHLQERVESRRSVALLYVRPDPQFTSLPSPNSVTAAAKFR